MCVPRWLYNALLSVMTMRRILATTAALCLGGCITVYGPVKTGGQQQQGSQTGQQPGMSEQISTSFIGNRKPDELLNAVELYFREKAITASVNDHTTGIIAGIEDDPGAEFVVSGLFTVTADTKYPGALPYRRAGLECR